MEFRWEFMYSRCSIFDTYDINTAQALTSTLFCQLTRRKSPGITEFVETAFDDVTAMPYLPEPYLRRLRTTNCIERLSEEFRRREKAIRIFPNQDLVPCMMGTVLIEQDEKWLSSRRYL